MWSRVKRKLDGQMNWFYTKKILIENCEKKIWKWKLDLSPNVFKPNFIIFDVATFIANKANFLILKD